MGIGLSGNRFTVSRTFDGLEFRFYDAYKYKADARKVADRLRQRGYNVRIFTALAHGRGYNRHEVYYRRSNWRSRG